MIGVILITVHVTQNCIMKTKDPLLERLALLLGLYKNSIPTNLHDSIDVHLVVLSEKITIQTMQEVKVALRKNNLMKITYHTPKQR